MIEKLNEKLRNPFFIMFFVVISLAVKALVKMWVGGMANSTMFVGDGVHNIGDMVENIIVIIVLFISLRPRSQEYSMGRGNTEFFATLGVSVLLMGIAVDFMRRSLGGLAQSVGWVGSFFKTLGGYITHFTGSTYVVDLLGVADVPAPEVVGPLFPVLLAITVVSILVSRLACYYQVKVGKETGHLIIEAAGEEMKVDSRIEMVTLVGLVSQWLFPSSPWLEYAFALVVALVVARTASELFSEAIKALSARTIGLEIDERLRQMCLCIPGVTNVVTLGTFRVGPLAVVKVTLNTMLDGAVPVLIDAVEKQLRHYVVEQGFLDCQVDVMFKKPTPNRHRIAYAVNCDQQGRIVTVAATVQSATHLAVCDIEFGEIDRTTLHTVPVDLEKFLSSKRVRTLYVFDIDTQRQSWQNDGVVLDSAASYLPAAVGLEKR